MLLFFFNLTNKMYIWYCLFPEDYIVRKKHKIEMLSWERYFLSQPQTKLKTFAPDLINLKDIKTHLKESL